MQTSRQKSSKEIREIVFILHDIMAVESVHLMKSTDLIKKELLDYGGFGEVYLCYHKTLGHVVQKNVYTGPPRNGRQKQSLLEEGSLMSRLNHPRIVKLLGIILEDGDYSLVMELIPRGNLHSMLEAVTVPLSLKARFVVEIMEGMIYLTENQVVHKDLKPENILVDNHFHLKIADLGLATSETWSKLTREESRRQSRLGKKPYVHAAGTLCYIAPEHLESIHTRSTEKSDVYSFAIVVWVILTGREPYENAIKEEQIYLCVCQGERPNEELIPPDTPPEIIDLMKTCWQKDPDSRPTFRECHRGFLPFYKEKLEACVEEDLKILLKSYEGPEDLLEKLKSLTTLEPHSPEDSSTLSRDSPTTLKSSDLGPVEASIEDLSFIPYGESQLEIDAAPPSSSLLEIKLAQEYNYHKYGSRIDEPEFMYNPLPRQPASSRWPGDVSSNGSSVKSWTKFTPDPNPEEEVHLRPAAAGSLLDGFRRSEKTDPFSLVDSDHDRHQHPQFDRMRSCPESGYHRADPVMLDSNPQIRCSAPVICPPSDSGAGTVFISNAEAIQIGSHNTMNLRTFQSNPLNSLCRGSFGAKYSELLSRYEDLAIAECHLEIVRQNVGSNWKRVARRLGLTDIDVETIEHDYDRDGLAEKVHQMLEFWKKKEGIVGFTVGNLCRALDGCIKPDVIRQLLGVS